MWVSEQHVFFKRWIACWALWCVLFGWLSAEDSLAQRVFRGTVEDAESGESLPAVTLQILETGEGTITNGVGVFELNILQLPVTILVRHIGYEEFQVQLDMQSPATLVIQLQPATYELDEVLVTDEDPAYNIMRKVIERKRQDRSQLSAYLAEVYSRFMLYSEFDLVQHQETIARHYWRPELGTRSLIRARRIKPVRSPRFRFASTQYIPDFYDDIIHVEGLDLIGPTHPDALDAYVFTLGEQRSMGDKKVYDIYFAPRTGFETALIGHVSVLDEEYAMVKIHARPSPDNVLPAPIKDWDVYFEQQFTPLGDSLWVPADLHVEGYVSFGRLGVTYPTARYRQVSRLTRYVVNTPAADSLFGMDSRVSYAPNVDQQDFLFRWNPGLIPMTPKEVEEVVTMNPARGLNQAFRPIGVLASYTAIQVEEERDEREQVARESLFGGVLSSFRLYYDRVDGFYLGLSRTLPLSRSLSLAADGGYGLSSEKMSYGAALAYRWGQWAASSFWPVKGFVRLGMEQRITNQYASRTYSRFVNSAATYVGWEDYFDYLEKSARSIELGVLSDRLSTRFTLGLSREEHQSVATVVDDKGRFFGGRPRENVPVQEGDYDLFSAMLEIGEVPEVQTRAEGNGLKLTMSRQVDWFDSEIQPFTKYEVIGQVTWPTFYKRRSWPNALHLRLYGASYTGTLPVQMLSVLDVSRRPIAPFGAFKSLNGLPIKGGNVWSVAWEHDFSTSLFEYLGWWSVARGGLGITLHGAHGQALAPSSFQGEDTFSLYDGRIHHEIGLSLTHLFNLPIRFDVVRNLNENRFALGVGVTKKLQ